MKKISKKMFFLIIILSLSFIYLINGYLEDNRKNNPKLDFESFLDISVEEISFERNGLYINGREYQANGISGYSKISLSGTKNELSLKDIVPPFKMEKKEKNDTLKIKKNNILYYLLITKEIKSSQN